MSDRFYETDIHSFAAGPDDAFPDLIQYRGSWLIEKRPPPKGFTRILGIELR